MGQALGIGFSTRRSNYRPTNSQSVAEGGQPLEMTIECGTCGGPLQHKLSSGAHFLQLGLVATDTGAKPRALGPERAPEASHGVSSAGTAEQAPEKTGAQEAPSLDTVAPHLLNETRLVGRWCANLRPIAGRMSAC